MSVRTHAEVFVAAIEHGAALSEVRNALASLYAAGCAFEERQDSAGWDGQYSVPQEQWRDVYASLARLFPAHLYHDVISDPFDMHSEPRVAVGDLADDLADVWRDMKEGLNALSQGVPESAAMWHWKLMFDSHWGVHASRALAMLHSSPQQPTKPQ